VFIGDEYKCVTVWIYFVGCTLESPRDLAGMTFNGSVNYLLACVRLFGYRIKHSETVDSVLEVWSCHLS
jgi:hypothetical protein